jgi:uncharacterized coiled-coil protein SlyX
MGNDLQTEGGSRVHFVKAPREALAPFKIAMLLGATIGICCAVSWALFLNVPHPVKEETVEQLSGQLGNLSQTNAAVTEQLKAMRRELDQQREDAIAAHARIERAVERVEEKLP